MYIKQDHMGSEGGRTSEEGRGKKGRGEARRGEKRGGEEMGWEKRGEERHLANITSLTAAYSHSWAFRSRS